MVPLLINLVVLIISSCSVVFVDTDLVPAKESRVGDLVENQIEARLIYQTAETLLRSGVQEDQIGVISLYRQQIKHLSYLFQDRKGVEILTADRSQGRDKECILISFVRSNDEDRVCFSPSAQYTASNAFLQYQIGDLMKDWRRINVSFTRARSKLIMFGSKKTLQTTPLLKEFFKLLESRDWILRLPANAHRLHEIAKHFPKKRQAEDDTEDVFSDDLTENTLARKKGKMDVSPKLLRTRPILRDLVNDTK